MTGDVLGVPGQPTAATLAQAASVPTGYSALSAECHGITSRSMIVTTA